MKRKKSQTRLILLVFAAIALIFFFFRYKVVISVYPGSTSVPCTADAKICPDGSTVGRTGPKCEFSPCPQ